MHLQSFNAAFPRWWITGVAIKGLGEETHTNIPQLQSNKMDRHTLAHTHPRTDMLVLVLNSSVKKRNTPSPELHRLMSFSATSQIFHRDRYKYLHGLTKEVHPHCRSCWYYIYTLRILACLWIRIFFLDYWDWVNVQAMRFLLSFINSKGWILHSAGELSGVLLTTNSAKHPEFHIPLGVVLHFDWCSRIHHPVQGWVVSSPYLTVNCCGKHPY